MKIPSMGVGLADRVLQAFLVAPAAALVGLSACTTNEPSPAPCVAVDVGNPCTIDACEPGVGTTHTPLALGSCSDGDACNGEETCTAEAVCAAGAPLTLDDGNPCTVDTCDPVDGVRHTPAGPGTLCEDTDACNGVERCDASGTCEAGMPLDLDDGNPCTVDACDAILGVIHTPVAAETSCESGDVCDGEERCDGAGNCEAGAPLVVDDGNPCTVDACDAIAGVAHAPAVLGTPCDNADVCDGAEACDGAGNCEAGVPLVVNDDGNPCTLDACDPVLGVIHTPAAAGTACANANACDGEETCNGLGACALVTPPAIDDSDPCTLDTCDAATGIDHHSCSAIDPTVATTIGAATAFLYTGADPIQIGVAPGTIVPTRAAVLRGKVQASDGSAMPDVTITIPQHPELGSTVTHADGMFDMAVHGGGLLTVNYAREGYLPVHRQVKAPWQDYAVVPDVVLTPYDSAVTTIDLDAIVDFEVARGTPVADDDGVRQATLLFPAGAAATMTLPGGGSLPLTTLSVRATEYTVGDRGLDAMPAPLPPTARTPTRPTSASTRQSPPGPRRWPSASRWPSISRTSWTSPWAASCRPGTTIASGPRGCPRTMGGSCRWSPFRATQPTSTRTVTGWPTT